MASKVRQVIETLFNIFDKEGNLVPFKLNEIQRRIDEEVIEPIERFREQGFEPDAAFIEDTIRNSILKYRQGGVTTLIMAWYLVECMSRYSVCVMLTHDKEHSEKLLYRARLMLKHMNGPKPKTTKLNDNEIAFAKTDSVFYIGTAGSKEFGRSATITHLHCSEIAFWKDPASLMKSLFQAVPKRTGVITQETTANGWGTWFQKSYYNYLTHKGGFRAHFFPWYIHDEYTSSTPWNSFEWYVDDYTEYVRNNVKTRRANELILYRIIRRAFPEMSRECIQQKLQWRREKILENLGDKSFRDALRDFDQEYPYCYEVAFTTSGGSLFPNVRQFETSRWQRLGFSEYGLTDHPKPGYSYSLGGDFSGGTGNDNASINVLCLETLEQVYRFADSHTDPLAFAEKIVEVGARYNNAYLVPEVNAHGLAGVAIIKRSYDLMRIYKHRLPMATLSTAQHNIPTYGYGWKTSATSKPFMIGITQQLLAQGLKLYDLMTVDELRSFSEDPDTGKLEGMGDHDDCAMSLFLAGMGLLKLMRLQGKHIQDFDEEGTDLPVIEVVETPAGLPDNVVLPTWRNEQGQYLVQFTHLFGKRKGSSRRSVHAS